jgi:hypothetical protein
MSDSNCTIMELHCLERARFEPQNKIGENGLHRRSGGTNSHALKTLGDFKRSLFNSRCMRGQWQRSQMRVMTPGSRASFHPLKNEQQPSSSDLAKSNDVKVE